MSQQKQLKGSGSDMWALGGKCLTVLCGGAVRTSDPFSHDKNRVPRTTHCITLWLVLLAVLFEHGRAQTVPDTDTSSRVPAATHTKAPLTLTLQDVLQRAKDKVPEFRAAMTDMGLAHQDRIQARAAFLPSINYNNQFLYTQGNGSPSGRFIANNSVHEYISQGNAHAEINLGLGQVATYRRAAAAEALAAARSEIASRGLVVTVVQSYYGLVIAERKYASIQQAAAEAQRFLRISQDLQRGGEVAFSDVIKAQLQSNDRERDLSEARLAMEKGRRALAVVLFSDFTEDFIVVDDLGSSAPLPNFPEVEQLAQRRNPDLAAALATRQMAEHEVAVARGAHFPTLSADYFYGIDASHFAAKTDGVRNLGYSVVAALNIPVWNWGATQSKVKQAVLRKAQADVELSATQRELLSNLRNFYGEASTARTQLDTLRESRDLAAESLRLTTLRYQSGEATVLEVVDVQNSLTQARNAYDDGEFHYRLALANLQTITGSF